jgi:hypothetical protein
MLIKIYSYKFLLILFFINQINSKNNIPELGLLKYDFHQIFFLLILMFFQKLTFLIHYLKYKLN